MSEENTQPPADFSQDTDAKRIENTSNTGEEIRIVEDVLGENHLWLGAAWSTVFGITVGFLAYLLVSLLTGGLHELKLLGLSLQTIFSAFLGVAIAYSFFKRGLRHVSIFHRGIGLFLGRIEENNIFRQGWCWHWPEPFGEIQQVSVEKLNLDVEPSDVLDGDRIPITVKTSLTYQVVSLANYLSIDDPVKLLRLEAEDQIRADVSGKSYQQLVADRKLLSSDLKRNLQGQMNSVGSGIKIWDVQIAGIDLPADLKKAATDIKREEEEARSDKKNTQTLGEQVKALMSVSPDLSAQEALAAIQASRGERKVITIDGGGRNTAAKDGAAFGIGMDAAIDDEPSLNKPGSGKLLRDRRRQPKSKE